MTDWRSEKLDRIRKLIQEADPDSVEEVKWRKPSNPDGVPTWSNNGILCTGETYKDKVKLTFARGASFDDPAGLFNASLDAGTRRAIDIKEGDSLDDQGCGGGKPREMTVALSYRRPDRLCGANGFC
jgi:hypothetical protein